MSFYIYKNQTAEKLEARSKWWGGMQHLLRHHLFAPKHGVEMKTIIQIYKEGKYFVAVDISTNVVDQGLTEEEAIKNLKKGLEEHYQILMELAHRDHKISFLDIEVEKYAKASRPVS